MDLAGLVAIYEALGTYDTKIERLLPWQEFENALNEIDKYRDDFSDDSVSLITKIKMEMMNDIDAHFHASQSIYEWVQFMERQLKIYNILFNNYDAKKSETQMKLLLKVLDSGVTQMNLARLKLEEISSSFSSIDENHKTIQSKDVQRNIKEFIFGQKWTNDQHIRKTVNNMKVILNFYDVLTQKIVQAEEEMLTKTKHMSDRKTEIQQMVRLVNLDESSENRKKVIELVQAIINRCRMYQDEHKMKN